MFTVTFLWVEVLFRWEEMRVTGSDLGQFLKRRGYKTRYVSGQLRSVNYETGVSVTFEKLNTSEVSYFKFIARSTTDNNFSLSIKPNKTQKSIRSTFSSFWDRTDLQISTPNQYHIQSVLSDSKLLAKLDRLIPVLQKFEILPRDDGRTYIVLQVNFKYEIANYCIRFIEEIFKVLNLDASMNTKVEKYQCFSCDTEISFENENCHACGVFAPKCVICLEDPEPNDQVIVFQCCQTYVHDEHGKLWLDSNPQCPYCYYENPRYIAVIN